MAFATRSVNYEAIVHQKMFICIRPEGVGGGVILCQLASKKFARGYSLFRFGVEWKIISGIPKCLDLLRVLHQRQFIIGSRLTENLNRKGSCLQKLTSAKLLSMFGPLTKEEVCTDLLFLTVCQFPGSSEEYHLTRSKTNKIPSEGHHSPEFVSYYMSWILCYTSRDNFITNQLDKPSGHMHEMPKTSTGSLLQIRYSREYRSPAKLFELFANWKTNNSSRAKTDIADQFIFIVIKSPKKMKRWCWSRRV